MHLRSHGPPTGGFQKAMTAYSSVVFSSTTSTAIDHGAVGFSAGMSLNV